MKSVLSQDTSGWPPVPQGFSHISRLWDSTHNLCAARILPGEYYVTPNDEIITTVLGSCVSACIRDPLTGVGGMNHFMLPGAGQNGSGSWSGDDSLTTRYGIAAMESVVNDILSQGARKCDLEVKLFGGGKVLAMEVNNVGERNVEFVRDFVRVEGLSVVAEDLGGTHPRKVNYFPRTGKVMVRRLRSLQNQTVANQDRAYEATMEKRKSPGEIELFD